MADAGPSGPGPQPPQAAQAGQASRRGRERGRGRNQRGRWHNGRGQPLPQGASGNGSSSSSSINGASVGHQASGGRGRGRGRGGIAASQASMIAPPRSFGGRLTGPGASVGPRAGALLNGSAAEFVPGQQVDVSGVCGKAVPAASAGKTLPSTAEDLPTRIHEDIDSGNYDCCICLNAVLRSSRLWTCPICWRVTHYACVAKWLKQKRRDAAEGAGGGDFDFALRCPACNSELPEDAAHERHCWCGRQKMYAAAPSVLAPHSCGRICGKARGRCPHPCSAVCHAGPCPPCPETGPVVPCFCGKHASTRPCVETDYAQAWSCRETCGSKMPCGIHRCERLCHADACGSCVVAVPSTCYCGKEQREMPCREREAVLPSFGHGQAGVVGDTLVEPFFGSFRCASVCGRPLDCGVHACQKSCHPQDEAAAHCPLSPDVVTRCPCGQTRLADLYATAEAAAAAVPPARISCRDAIPLCGKTCGRALACGHRCAAQCHEGACPPCVETVTARCRCGRTATQAVCSETTTKSGADSNAIIECDTPCRALLSCGQHKCRNVCCGGREKAAARQASSRGGSSRSAVRQGQSEFEAEHVCVALCGRPLRCGKHACPRVCHRGACLSCTETIAETLSCACGRTVLQPPLPCGSTLPPCQFDCSRELPCGHAAVAHRCHAADQPCPRCPQLVSKVCLCGKYALKRVACGTGDLKCDKVCGLPLKCGLHTCTRTCHRPGECEDAEVACSQPCGREKPLCGHPCSLPCHVSASSSAGGETSCAEDEPCRSRSVATCECQRRRQEVRCLACRANPSPTHALAPACDDECRRLQRNAAVKSALGVADDHDDGHVPYAAETMDLFRKSRAWAQEQELLVRAFADSPDQRRLRFRPMAAARRAFLHLLAADYGLDSQSQDPEPHRHVALFKTPRFVSAPAKTLAQCDTTQQRRVQEEKKRELAEAAAAAAEAESAAAAAASAASAAAKSQRRPCNAILLPAQLADQAAVHADMLADVLPLLAEERQRDSSPLPVRIGQARLEPAVLPSGEAVIRAAVPAAAPAAVEQLLRSLLPYAEGLAGSSGPGEDDAQRMRLCHVEADMRIAWCDGDDDEKQAAAAAAAARGGSGSNDVGQWNVVASRTGRRAAALGTGGGTSSGASSAGTGRRALFTLKKPSLTVAERQRRMEILAQEPVDERGVEEEEEVEEKKNEEMKEEEKEEEKEEDKDPDEQQETEETSDDKSRSTKEEEATGQPDAETREETLGEAPDKQGTAVAGHVVQIVQTVE